MGCIYGLVALGFVLIYKATELVNFAQGDLLMLGAFTCYMFVVWYGVGYWTAFALAVGIGVAVDYSLFILSRYREELHHGGGPEELQRRIDAGELVPDFGPSLLDPATAPARAWFARRSRPYPVPPCSCRRP